MRSNQNTLENMNVISALSAFPFEVCHRIARFLGVFDDEQQTRSATLLSTRILNTRLYNVTKSFYVAITCPVTSRHLILPCTGQDQNQVPTPHMLYDHMMTHGLNAFAQIMWLTGRNLQHYTHRLRTASFIHNEFAVIQRETRLHELLDHQSYSACAVVRKRISELLAPFVLPAHAQETHVREIMTDHDDALTPGVQKEVEYWISWLRRYGQHVSAGSACLAVECAQNYACIVSRKRPRLHDHKERTEIGYNTVIGDNTAIAGNVLQQTPLQQTPLQQTPLQTLPHDVLSAVLTFCGDYDQLESLSALSACSRFFRTFVRNSPLGPVISHFETKQQLHRLTCSRHKSRVTDGIHWQAPCSEAFDTYSVLLRDVLGAYSAYGSLYRHVQEMLRLYSTEERHTLLLQFLKAARQYVALPPLTESFKRTQLTRGLKYIDFRLLDMFGVDVMRLTERVIHELPPRAFHEGSKHKKSFRRMFVEPDAYSHHRGAKMLYDIETGRQETRQQRRLLFKRLRAVEAFEVAHLQRLLDQLRDTGLVNIDPAHPAATISTSCNALLTYDELQELCLELVTHAEVVFDKSFVAHVIHRMRVAFASKVKELMPALFFDINTLRVIGLPLRLPSPSSSPLFFNWRVYMSRLLKGFRDTQKRHIISIRIATELNHEGVLADGFTACYVNNNNNVNNNASIGTTTITISDLLSYQCLAVHGLVQSKEGGRKWPLVNTVKGAHAIVLWSKKPMEHAVIVLKDSTPHTRAVFETFSATEADVTAALKTHAKLTGKCAPCGRSLKDKETWIGTTCAAHLPQSWNNLSPSLGISVDVDAECE